MQATASLVAREFDDGWMNTEPSCDGASNSREGSSVSSPGRAEFKRTSSRERFENTADGAPAKTNP